MFLPDDQVDRFIPFVVEATGNIGKKGTEFIEEICKMRSAVFASAEENDRIMNKRSYTTRAICAAVMKGNAAMLKTDLQKSDYPKRRHSSRYRILPCCFLQKSAPPRTTTCNPVIPPLRS